MLFLLFACHAPVAPSARATPEGPETTWPAPDALTAAAPVFPADFGVRRITIDPGHGAPGNPGNDSAFCASEQDEMLRVAEHLAESMVATGHFEVQLARAGATQPDYWTRVNGAAAWGAEVYVSLHSDARGLGLEWEPTEGTTCTYNEGYGGYSVLWGDEGDAELVAKRHALARALGTELAAAGFGAFSDGYGFDYGADDTVPGVYVDRHTPKQRILVLRRPTMPSVIVETHQAWDVDEATRWGEESTLDAFDAAVARGLVAALQGTKPPK